MSTSYSIVFLFILTQLLVLCYNKDSLIKYIHYFNGGIFMIHYNVEYTQSQPYHFQGNKSELQKEMKRNNSYVLSGSCGSYVLVTSAHGCITETNTNDNSIRKKYPKNFIRDHYNIERVSKKWFYKLKEDLEQGNVRFDDIY